MGDHGSPPWSAMTIYHNTVLAKEQARDASMASLGAVRSGLPRRTFNNLFVHLEKLPGFVPPTLDQPVEADGNLYWAPGTSEQSAATLFQRYRQSKDYAAQKEKSPNGVSDRSLVADPRFAISDLNADAFDFRLSRESPAVNSGVALPADWPDPLREVDKDAPDRGAIPVGSSPLEVGRSAGQTAARLNPNLRTSFCRQRSANCTLAERWRTERWEKLDVADSSRTDLRRWAGRDSGHPALFVAGEAEEVAVSRACG